MRDKLIHYFKGAKNFIHTRKKLSLIGGIIVLLVLILISRNLFFNQPQTTYQTSKVEKGTLITSVTASGNISAGSSVSIDTQATGIVKAVYVKNGETVAQGQKIAEITPDLNSQQRQAAAWATYLSALNSERSAEDSKLSADASMWSAQQAVLDAQNNVNYKNGNTTNPSTKAAYTDLEKQSIDAALTQAQKSFTAAEQKYKDANYAINSAQASLSSAWLSYQQTSSTITAPISGVVNGLTLTEGLPLTSTTSSSSSSSSSNSSSSSSTSSQSIGTITLKGSNIQAVVDLTEVDVTNVKVGQKVTITLDAFPNKTFVGKVLNIDTNGSVSSGVTSYPTTIVFDTAPDRVYPNMSVNATIITNIKENAILVPSAAIQTTNGQSTVKVMQNGKPVSVNVEIGDSNDTQTEIVSGLKAGETVVTNTSTTSTSQSQTSSSPFGGGFGGGRRD
jgi:macrolide-specific efflux system membrane fusion protein